MIYRAGKRRRALAFFSIVYIILVSLLVFLLFMAPGLDFEVGSGEEAGKAFVKNTSSHLIREVTVSTLDGNVLLYLQELKPGEKAEIQVAEKAENLRLIASAPFHSAIERTLSVSELGGKGRISYNVAYPSTTFTDIDFNFILEVCNDSSLEVISLEVSESHDSRHFAQENSNETVSLRKKECKTLVYLLTPKEPGSTEIFFNAKGLNVAEQFSRTITIEE